MLEIIALIFLTRFTGNLAATKGLKVGMWKFYTVLYWFLGEFAGCIAGLLFFDLDNIVSIALVGYMGAITAFFLVKKYLEELPDLHDDISDNIN